MLPAEHRLCDPTGFRRAGRRGERANSPTLVLHLLVQSDQLSAPPRAGFVVSKAVGNAVVRNRVKRRLRAAMASHLSSLPQAAVVVVRAKPAAAAASFASLARDLERCLAAVRRTGVTS